MENIVPKISQKLFSMRNRIINLEKSLSP